VLGTSKKPGFTLIEIVVAILIIAVVATIVVPNLQRRVPYYERQQFITHVNALTQLAWNNALSTGKIHRLVIDAVKKNMVVEIAGDSQAKKKDDFVPLKETYLKPTYQFADTLELKNLYIEGEDQITKHGGGKKSSLETWFYIMPDGLTQAVIMNMVDQKDRSSGDKPREFSLVLNPFSAQFTEYDTFQKP
jgi:prepilin-type N-terminal cleavage/methylation domain-containing protein